MVTISNVTMFFFIKKSKKNNESNPIVVVGKQHVSSVEDEILGSKSKTILPEYFFQAFVNVLNSD